MNAFAEPTNRTAPRTCALVQHTPRRSCVCVAMRGTGCSIHLSLRHPLKRIKASRVYAVCIVAKAVRLLPVYATNGSIWCVLHVLKCDARLTLCGGSARIGCGCGFFATMKIYQRTFQRTQPNKLMRKNIFYVPIHVQRMHRFFDAALAHNCARVTWYTIEYKVCLACSKKKKTENTFLCGSVCCAIRVACLYLSGANGWRAQVKLAVCKMRRARHGDALLDWC